METTIVTPRAASTTRERVARRFWQRVISRLSMRRHAELGQPHPVLLLPTFEASDRELRELAEPVFRERIEEIRNEVFTRYVTGGTYP